MKKTHTLTSTLKKTSGIFIAMFLILQATLSTSVLKEFAIPLAKASFISSFISGLNDQPSNTNANYTHSGSEVFTGDTLTFVASMTGTFTLNSVNPGTCATSNQSATGVTLTCTTAGFVSPTYNINTGAGPTGGISINSTSQNFSGENKIVSKSVNVTSITAPSFSGNQLSPNTIAHTHANPHDVSVSVVCNLNGGTFVSLAASGTDVVGPGSVSGSGTTRTLNFDVRNTTQAEYNAQDIVVTCTTSFASTFQEYLFTFTQTAPSLADPNTNVVPSSKSHSDIAEDVIGLTITMTDPDPSDDVTVDVTGVNFLDLGVSPGAATFANETQDPGNDLVTLDLTGIPADYNGTAVIEFTMDDGHDVVNGSYNFQFTDTSPTIEVTHTSAPIEPGGTETLSVTITDADPGDATEPGTLVVSCSVGMLCANEPFVLVGGTAIANVNVTLAPNSSSGSVNLSTTGISRTGQGGQASFNFGSGGRRRNNWYDIFVGFVEDFSNDEVTGGDVHGSAGDGTFTYESGPKCVEVLVINGEVVEERGQTEEPAAEHGSAPEDDENDSNSGEFDESSDTNGDGTALEDGFALGSGNTRVGGGDVPF
ncbi:MAG: hypothetical protein AB7J40_02360 [Candidatus Altimarinota bacterium]